MKKKLSNGKSSKVPARRLKIVPWAKTDQDDLGDLMVDWVIKTDTVSLEEFPLSQFYDPTLFYRIADENEYFSMCLNFAKWTISAKLMNGWKNRKYDKELWRLYTMYNPWYKETQNERTMHDAKGRALGNAIFNVQMDPIDNAPEVDEQLKKKIKAQA